MKPFQHTSTLTLIVFTGFLIVFSCSGQDKGILVNKNKKGGLFESNINGKTLTFYNKNESIIVDTTTFIPFNDFEILKRGKSPFDGVFVLNIKLNDEGTSNFKEMSSRNIGKQICFVIDDKIIAAPIINQEIPEGQIQMTIINKQGMELIIDYFKK